MIGFLQVIIYLLCVYLVYKGIEIFQTAFVSTAQTKTKATGIVIGIASRVGAVVVGIVAVIITELMARGLEQNLNNIPKLLN